MNTYNLPARPLYTLAALTLHECTPGHSFQAALALEGPEVARPGARLQARRAADPPALPRPWPLRVEPASALRAER